MYQLPLCYTSHNSRSTSQAYSNRGLYFDTGITVLSHGLALQLAGVQMFVSVENTDSCALSISKRTLPAHAWRTHRIACAIALAIGVLGSSAAQAQNCNSPNLSNGFIVNNMAEYAASTAANLSAAINIANTAFLTQSIAFVGSPADAKTDQTGGGVWVRGVGGEVTDKGTLSGTATLSQPTVGFTGNTSIQCGSDVHETFAGVQVGQDISKLNIDGWNIHVGTTAGMIGTQGQSVGGVAFEGNAPFNNSVQVPFIGTYAAVSNGGFFVDALVRGDFYQADLNSPALNLANQNLNARGLTIGGLAGYQFSLPSSSWFIEPSGGLIYSRVQVDPLNGIAPPPPGGTITNNGIQGTMQLNDIVTTTGRLGIRVGESFSSGGIVWQPFAAASVWTDFGSNATGSFTSCGNGTTLQNCLFYLGSPAQLTSSFTADGIGTYGQYSLGVAGQIINTGWLGFVRVDYREGERIESWSGTGGIRYQFTPELPIATKMPIYKATPSAPPYSWTGFYIGGELGADAGGSHQDFGGVASPFFSSGPVPGGGVGDVGPRVAGLLGGLEVGYNYQVGKWVLGVEADTTDSNTKGSVACTNLDSPEGIAGAPPRQPLWNSNCNAQASWIGTVTGRVGTEFWDRALLFVKGGAAFTHETFSATCNLPNALIVEPQQCFNPAGALLSALSAGANATGGTIGIGSEFALTRNWSAKAEWDYIKFDNRNVIASDGTAMNVGMSVNEVKIGANYHFTP
jgi:opacity protein-like surface antigen